MTATRLTLDFAPASVRAPSRMGIALLVAGGVGAFAAAFACGAALSMADRQSQALDARRQQATADAAAFARPASAAPSGRTKAALRIARTLQTPWSDLLETLEAAPHGDVALLAIEPSARDSTVRLTAESRDPDGMVAYLHALQSDARLKRVILLSHQVQPEAAGSPVRFQIQAIWGNAP
jgi:Tfp pilus assembly protein PilN